MLEEELIVEPSEYVKELILNKSASDPLRPYRLISVAVYGMHKGYFGVMKNGAFYHPDELLVTTFSYIGPGAVDFIWPGGTPSYTIPNGHYGLAYWGIKYPRVKSIPEGRVSFLALGDIQQHINRIHVVEHERKDHQGNKPAEIRVFAWWHDNNNGWQSKTFFNAKIHEKKYDKYFDIPPE